MEGGGFRESWWFWLTGDGVVTQSREEGGNPYKSAFSAVETDNSLPPCQRSLFSPSLFLGSLKVTSTCRFSSCLAPLTLDFLTFPTGASSSSCHVRVQECEHLR